MTDIFYHNLRNTSGMPTAILCCEGRIAALGTDIRPTAGAESIDGEGKLLLPALVEPHVHLDKTLWGEAWQPGPAAPRLIDYITNERRVLTACETPSTIRAGRLLAEMLSLGTTAVRSHIDVAPDMGLSHVEAMLQVRAEWADLMDLQFVAFPQQGVCIRSGTLGLMEEAIAMGVETVGGLDPAGIDGDPDAQLKGIFALAAKTGAGVDIHLHDKGELGAWQIDRICDYVASTGLTNKTMISHAYCLGMISPERLESLGRRLADLGVSLMTSAPADISVPPVADLAGMGVNVCCGSDGIRDAWSPFGNGDMLERAFLTAYRFDWGRDEDFALALSCATGNAARALGLEDRTLAEGSRADFVFVDAFNVGDAICRRPRRRTVVRSGIVVASDGRLTMPRSKI